MRPALLVPLLAALALPGASASMLALPVPVSTEVQGLTVYPTWPVLTAELQDLAARYPDILRLHSAGISGKGLDLWLVEVADFEDPDRVPLEEREVLWVDGGTHANEYSGVMFVMHLLRWLAQGYGQNDTATWIAQHRHTFIMPLLNPEGSLNGVGRLNGNLVNINRNYPVGWGDLAEDPVANNPGPYPASEAETRAVVAMWDRLQPDYMASIHCCGNLWLFPYGIEGRDPHADDLPVLQRICDEAYAEVREDCGPIWSTIYPASGSSVDTAYEVAGSAAFGFEMSGREALLLWGQPFSGAPIEETESESWRGVMHAFLNVERYGAHPEARVEGVTGGELRLAVQNTGWGNLTRGSVLVQDARGVLQQVALPWLAPGAEAIVAVPGSFGAGSFPVTLTYGKRALGGESVVHQTLGVVRTAAGLAGAFDALELASVQAAPQATPWPLALGLLGVAGAALARRRA